MSLDIIIKLLIGFVIFFGGVVFNVKIMSSEKPSELMAKLSFVVIAIGLVVLVAMANSIDVGKLKPKAAVEEPEGEAVTQEWF